jgi:hypothetical protein
VTAGSHFCVLIRQINFAKLPMRQRLNQRVDDTSLRRQTWWDSNFLQGIRSADQSQEKDNNILQDIPRKICYTTQKFFKYQTVCSAYGSEIAIIVADTAGSANDLFGRGIKST